MAKTELDRLLALGLIFPRQYRALKRRKGRLDDSDRDTAAHFSYSGRGDDESDATAVGFVGGDHVDAPEFQRAKRGFVPDVGGQQPNSKAPTGVGHINRSDPARRSWEKPRRSNMPSWDSTSGAPSVARARKNAADEYWSVDWYGGPDNTRME
jgi:hypothetical protein